MRFERWDLNIWRVKADELLEKELKIPLKGREFLEDLTNRPRHYLQEVEKILKKGKLI